MCAIAIIPPSRSNISKNEPLGIATMKESPASESRQLFIDLLIREFLTLNPN